MFSVLICDSKKKYIDVAISFLNEYAELNNESFEIKYTTNIYDILDYIEHGVEFDIYIMDVIMPSISGMYVAEQMRSRNMLHPIIFATDSPDYALQAFEVFATHYLVKPYSRKNFFRAIQKAIVQHRFVSSKSIVLKSNGEYINITLRDIVYVESDDNHQKIKFENGKTLAVRITAGKLLDIINTAQGFYRCGRSFIINLMHISKISDNKVIFKNGDSITIPHSAIGHLAEAFVEHCNDYAL